jgi:hypothetical protein
VKSKGTFYYRPHQNKERSFVAALEAAGYSKSQKVTKELSFAILDHDVGPGGKGWRTGLERLQQYRIPVFMIPHAARPTAFWDGLYPIWPYTVATFVIAKGHIDVMRAYDYPLPLEVVGWPFCELKPFQPISKVQNILFAPIHPNANGWLCDDDLFINRETFNKLYKYCKRTGTHLTVRYIRDLEQSGLEEVDGATFYKGQPDTSVTSIDEADLIVAHQTFGYLGVARGKPTLMAGEYIPPRSGDRLENFGYVHNWDKYKHLVQFPLDILKGRTSDLIRRASKSDADIADWKENIVGEQFDPEKFVKRLESYLPKAKSVYDRDNIKKPYEARFLSRKEAPLVQRVLVYCPMYPDSPKVKPQTKKCLEALKWDCQFDIVYGESSHSQHLVKDDHRRELVEKYNQAREMTLAGKYDALLTIEADMIIPSDTLDKLSRVDADVVYGLYVSRHNLQWFLYFEGPTVGKQISRDKKLRRQVWGKIAQSCGIGNGCTLIHRNVLEKITFENTPGVAQDWIFAQTCQKYGFRQAHDCSVVCGHINGNEVIWPNPQHRYRVERISNV